jgi:hypothetical protein
MDDLRGSLKTASRLVTAPDRSYDRLLERRERKRRRQRLASFVVALVVGVGSIGGAALLLAGLGPAERSVGAGWGPDRDLAMGADDYLYLRIESSDLGDGHIRDEETWWGLDGSGEVRNRGTRLDKYPYPPAGVYGEGEFPIWLRDVDSLSTDPSVLATQLRAEAQERFGEPATPETLWDATTLLLFETPYATPELRAALFDVASGIDGVTVEEEVRDPAGRLGIRLRLSDAAEGATWDVYFDPGTHQALGWSYRSSRGGYVWEVIDSGIVDEIGALPGGDQWLTAPTDA